MFAMTIFTSSLMNMFVAVLIETALVAACDEYINDQAQRSEIREQVGGYMEDFQNEGWWNEMEEYVK